MKPIWVNENSINNHKRSESVVKVFKEEMQLQ